PLLREGNAVAAVHLVAGAPFERRADLEAAREDDAVELVFDAVGDDALLGDSLDALAVGVYERDVGEVVRRQVLVVTTRPLAELPVIRLQALGRVRILDDLRCARADLFHLLEVRELERADDRARILANAAAPQQLADDLGPAVHHEVFFGKAAARQRR